MAKNHPYTLSYFRKRLRDAGFESLILVNSFPEGDKRYWTLAIDKNYMFFCTCVKTDKEYHFELGDNHNRIPYEIVLHTKSMAVIIEFLRGLMEKKENKNETTP